MNNLIHELRDAIDDLACRTCRCSDTNDVADLLWRVLERLEPRPIDKVPEDCGVILGFDALRNWEVMERWTDEPDLWFSTDGHTTYSPTHFLPFPEPPEADNA